MKDTSCINSKPENFMKAKTLNDITAYEASEVRERLFEVTSKFEPHLWDKSGNSTVKVLEEE
jgi:hypothetical protein